MYVLFFLLTFVKINIFDKINIFVVPIRFYYTNLAFIIKVYAIKFIWTHVKFITHSQLWLDYINEMLKLLKCKNYYTIVLLLLYYIIYYYYIYIYNKYVYIMYYIIITFNYFIILS